MSDKRYLGNIITPTPTEPSGPYQDSAASGVWSLQEAFTYTKAGLWPTAGNAAPIGVFFGNTSDTNAITRVDLTTSGTSSDFGNQSLNRYNQSACSSATRGLCFGGYSSTYGYTTVNIVEYVTIASASNATDFGDLTQSVFSAGGTSNSTRGLRMGGGNGGAVNIIGYCTIASIGNFADFGDLQVSVYQNGCCASPTRALSFSGVSPGAAQPSPRNIQYITIASTGNASDFGDATQAIRGGGAASSSTRAVIGGGTNSGSASNSIEYVTIASTGNGTDFGDLTSSSLSETSGASSSVKAFFVRSDSGCRMETVTIASTGNSTDFGTVSQMSAVSSNNTTITNSHGGLA